MLKLTFKSFFKKKKKERAQAEGWNKANKLEGRSTSNGLIGVQVDGKRGVILELNCETDFVAKNSKFMSLLNEVVANNLKAAKKLSSPGGSENDGILMKKLDKQVIGEIDAKDGKSLADLVALNIGLIGENITPGKAEHFVATSPDIHLIGYTHPPGGLHQGPLFYGRYGVMMVIEKKTDSKLFSGQSLDSIGRQLCQHVVGMNPSSVGDLSNPDSWPAIKDEEKEDRSSNSEEDRQTSEADFMGTTETEMIHQPFLLDTDRLVRDVLLEAGLDIKYFARYEVGQ